MLANDEYEVGVLDRRAARYNPHGHPHFYCDGGGLGAWPRRRVAPPGVARRRRPVPPWARAVFRRPESPWATIRKRAPELPLPAATYPDTVADGVEDYLHAGLSSGVNGVALDELGKRRRRGLFRRFFKPLRKVLAIVAARKRRVRAPVGPPEPGQEVEPVEVGPPPEREVPTEELIREQVAIRAMPAVQPMPPPAAEVRPPREEARVMPSRAELPPVLIVAPEEAPPAEEEAPPAFEDRVAPPPFEEEGPPPQAVEPVEGWRFGTFELGARRVPWWRRILETGVKFIKPKEPTLAPPPGGPPELPPPEPAVPTWAWIGGGAALLLVAFFLLRARGGRRRR